MWGMDWPTALVIFGMFALAGIAIWCASDPPDAATRAELAAMAPVVEAAQAWAEAPDGDIPTQSALIDAVETFNEGETDGP
jgi:hypothetical protein